MYSLILFLSFIGILAVGFLMYIWRREQDWWRPSENFESLSSLIPFDDIVEIDGKSYIKCTDGSLAVVLELDSMDYTILTSEMAENIEGARLRWLNEMSKEKARIRIFSIRDRVHCKTDVKFPNDILQRMHDSWMRNIKDVFVNRHYIVLSVSPKKTMLKKEKVNATKLKSLVTMTRRMMVDYNPRELKHEKMSDLLSFWTRLAIFQEFKVARSNDITKAIACSDALFNEKEHIIEIGGRYTKAICINVWGSICDNLMVGQILRMSEEVIICENMQGHSPIESISTLPGSLDHQKKQAKYCQGSQDIQAEYDDAIANISSGAESQYDSQFTIFVTHTDKDQLRLAVEKIEEIFTHRGIKPIVATKALKYIYTAMFPSNDELLYKAKLTSDVIAHLTPFAGEAKGFTKSRWGDAPIRYCKSATGGSYPLIIHENDSSGSSGHSLTFGKTGSGKSQIWKFLIGGMLGQGVKVYIFDRLRGAYIFTEAVDGLYVSLDNMLNFLSLEPTPSNISFLNNLLLMMSGCNDKLSVRHATLAVKNMYGWKKDDRVLNKLFSSCITPGDFKDGLERWVNGNQYSHWFNGMKNGKAFDGLDMTSNQLVAFDMTEIQEYPDVASCVQSYIMHRIRNGFEGKSHPHMIFIDEAAPQLENAQFRKEVKVMLKEHRKLSGCVNLCFQTPDILQEPGMDALKTECPITYIHPNKKITIEDYEALKLNEFEKYYVTESLPISPELERSVLVKRDDESIILNTDMSGDKEIIKLYSSERDDVNLVKDLKKTHGEFWVKEYLARG